MGEERGDVCVIKFLQVKKGGTTTEVVATSEREKKKKRLHASTYALYIARLQPALLDKLQQLC